MSSPLLGVAGINAITFGAYGNVLRMLPDQDSISSITLAGATAGLIQVLNLKLTSIVHNRIKFSDVQGILRLMPSLLLQTAVEYIVLNTYFFARMFWISRRYVLLKSLLILL